jgi:phosphotransferase system enzyme I (PtsP)
VDGSPNIGHRTVLRRLRQVMAGSGSAQERLNEIVKIVAAEMAAEVCSIYIQRAGDILELFATQGLNPEAVHATRLQLGEGLVGTVALTAEPLNLPDAQAHPNFSYRPETGEEVFASLLGVPVIRGGRVRGVLVIQNRDQRTYSEDEEEALQIITVVIAEIIASGNLANADASAQLGGGRSFRSSRHAGLAINGGLAVGEAVLHTPNVSIRQMFADDSTDEHERLREAMATMHAAIDELLASSDLRAAGEHHDVLDSYRRFAKDRGWLRRIREGIDSGLTADAAVQQVREDTVARMRSVSDPYMRERLSDLEDVAIRLMQHLGGGVGHQDLPDDIILVARNLGPAELLDYDTSRVRALVTEEGGATSHVSIIARALGIPVVGKIDGLMKNVDPGDPIIVDGDNGQIFIRPTESVRTILTDTLKAREQRRSLYASMRGLKTVTRDGVPISLNINCGMLADMQWLGETGADSVGLFRTEIPFMVRSTFPDLAQQTRIYSEVLAQSDGKPVHFRTLDIGGDKQLPYLQDSKDENPALGWRSIRVGLDRPGMLRQQLRAMLRAASGQDLYVMFPMIAEVAEFKTAVNVLHMERDRIDRRSVDGIEPPSNIRVGAMLEVPGLIWQLDALLPHLDFLSIGSNDLFQFLFAIDRGNPRVADRYDVLSPALLSAVRDILRKCDEAGVPVSLCGEMAGDPLEAMALLGIGMRSLSLSPSAFGAVKAMTMTVDTAELSAYMNTLLQSPDHSLRRKLRAFALDHGIVLET